MDDCDGVADDVGVGIVKVDDIDVRTVVLTVA